MKHNVKLPEEEQSKFKLIPEGEYKFQVVDIKDETDKYAQTVCEVVGGEFEGKSLLYRVNFEGDFLWLTKLFLKCIDEPHNGELVIDTDAWIGRQFYGKVKHSKDGKYANIKELVSREISQVKASLPQSEINPKDIQWEE